MKKNIIIFHLKTIVFTAVKYYSILYGRVFVMQGNNTMKTVFLSKYYILGINILQF